MLHTLLFLQLIVLPSILLPSPKQVWEALRSLQPQTAPMLPTAILCAREMMPPNCFQVGNELAMLFSKEELGQLKGPLTLSTAFTLKNTIPIP